MGNNWIEIEKKSFYIRLLNIGKIERKKGVIKLAHPYK